MKRMNVFVTLLITLFLTLFVTSGFSSPSKISSAIQGGDQQTVQKININKAGADDLVSLPGIGQKKAEAILQYLQKNGKFEALEDLIHVKGIGPKLLQKIMPYVTLQ